MKKDTRQIEFDGSIRDYLMRNSGFTVGLNMPTALSGETTFGLPPYSKRMPFLVDKYPSCPKDWMRSEGKIKSFFVPVIEGRGMWLDFNENENNSHHVAIVISVQGVNPVTGMPCHDAQLEQYIEECPKHKIKFGPDRYCSKCDYKWPKQNYISTTATPRGLLWLDGFRTVEGVVRQYILTAEKMRGVASNVIGKDRVYAIGLSFFVSKEKRPPQVDTGILRGMTVGSASSTTYGSPMWYSPVHTPINWQIPGDSLESLGEIGDSYTDNSTSGGGTQSNINFTCSNSSPQYGEATKSSKRSKGVQKCFSSGLNLGQAQLSKLSNDPNLKITTHHAIQVQKLEVGAGAKISQAVYDDPERLEFWHDTPESIICINYCSEDDARKIVEQGEVNIEGHKEGFLKEVPVGN